MAPKASLPLPNTLRWPRPTTTSPTNTTTTTTMATLRRLAQENYANTVSPVKPAAPKTPVRVAQAGPSSSPRTRLVYNHSPFITPSRSASTPFDWEAARARKPAPYATPLAGRRVRNASPTKGGGAAVKKERVVRKKGLFQRCVRSLSHSLSYRAKLKENGNGTVKDNLCAFGRRLCVLAIP